MRESAPQAMCSERLEATAKSYAAVIGLPVDVVRKLLAGDEERQRRACDCLSVLGSVHAEGLDPAGIVPELHAWVLGDTTLDTLIRRELDQAAEIYGPPTPMRET